MRPRSDCPGNDRLAEAFRGGPDAEADRAVLDHGRVCPACHRKIGVLRALEIELLDRGGEPPESVSPAERRRLKALARTLLAEAGARADRRGWAARRPALIGAAALVLVALAGGLSISRWLGADRLRGPAEIRLIQPGGALGRAPVVFSWTGIPNADGYSFSLHDDSLAMIHKEGTKLTRISLPEDVRRRLAPGGTYVWSIEAYHDDGRPLDRKSRSFTIVRRP